MIRLTICAAPTALLLGSLACGQAIITVQDSTPRIVSARVDLPKNLVLVNAFLDAPSAAKLNVITERVQATARDGRDGLVMPLSASGVLRANAPVGIHSLQVLMAPARPAARWTLDDSPGATQLSFPTLMAQGAEARWSWVNRAAVDDRIFDGIEFQARAVYEVFEAR